MGKGPANKVIIGTIATGEEVIAIPTYKGYSIPANAYLDVYWSTNSAVLYASYEGEPNDRYLVQCQNDENLDLHNPEDRRELEVFLKNNAGRKDGIRIHTF